MIVQKCFFSKCIAAVRRDACTHSCNSFNCSGLFCNAIAHGAIRSIIDKTDNGSGCKYVASVMSKEINGVAPVAA